MNLQMRDISLIKPYEKNSKKHPEEQVKRIAESISRFGWDQPIVVDKDGVIIKGHGRRLAALMLGHTKVPVLVRDDLTPEQVKAARLSDNRAAISDIDTELFRAELDAINADLLKGIFDDKELDFSVADLGEMNVDAFIEDVDAAVTEQDQKTKERVAQLENRRVPIAKAFGFKDIVGSSEIYVSRFMAHIQATTGKSGEEALVEYIKSVVDLG